MKKILFVLPTLTNGGAERVASIISNELCRLYEIRFLLLENDSNIAYELDSRIQIKSAKINVHQRGNKLKSIICYFKNFVKQYSVLKKNIAEFVPDIVVSFLPKADMLAYWARRKGAFKWISSERNDPTVRNFVERFVLRSIYKKTDGFVCQSRVVSEYYQKMGVKNCVVISNPKNSGVVLNEKIPFEHYAVAVGRFDFQKNYKMLISAFVKAKQRVSCDTKLVVLGSGPLYGECQDLVERFGVKDQVLLLGRKQNVGDYLRNADFFVMSSNYEGMPNALIEAMDASLPVICTDFFTGTARELITEKNGCLVPVRNELAMIHAIEKMLNSSYDVLKQMGLFSKSMVAHIDLKSICNQWNVLLTNV